MKNLLSKEFRLAASPLAYWFLLAAQQGNVLAQSNLGWLYQSGSGVEQDYAEAMKAYYPWRVFYINGEYRAYGIKGWTFSYPCVNFTATKMGN